MTAWHNVVTRCVGIGSKRRRIPVTFPPTAYLCCCLSPRITVHVVLANYFSGQMDTCGCCAVREICQHLRPCQLRIFNAFPSTESTTSVSQIFSFSGLPPGTFIFLSCSLLGHICSLIKHTAVSQLMAKLRNPGRLISPSSQVHALTSS